MLAVDLLSEQGGTRPSRMTRRSLLRSTMCRTAGSFYGPLPDGADFAGSSNAAVLGVYAQHDERVNASRDAAKMALRGQA